MDSARQTHFVGQLHMFLSLSPPALILNRLASDHSLPLSNLGKAFEIPIGPTPQTATFLVTS